MKLKENLSIRKVGDQYMMITASELGLDYTRVITLNESAAYLLESVENRDFCPVDWVELLMERYYVTHETAATDVQTLLDVLTQAGVFE